MTQHDDDRLIAWLHDEPRGGSAGALEGALKITRHTRQRPAWLVSAAGGTIRTRTAGPSVLRVVLVLAALAVVSALLVGGLVVAGIIRLPPAPSLLFESPSPSSVGQQLVFYNQITGVWVAKSDGTDARELVPDSQVFAVSPDGKLLGLWSGEGVVSVAEVTGRGPRLTNIREVGLSGFTFSPDATKLAFVQRSPEGEEVSGSSSVIAIMDVASGSVVELESTRTTASTSGQLPGAAVQWPDGYNSSPQWSPDGSQLVFGREGIGVPTSEHRLYDRTLYVVNVDGSNLRQLVPRELFAGGRISWAPDGSRILFTSAVEWLGLDSTGVRENSNQYSDVYSVRPDGTDLRRLTNDTLPRVDYGVPVQFGATAVSWTREGRVIFTRVPLGDTSGGSPPTPPTELWVMDSHGQNQQQLDATELSELNAVGCLVCPYPPNDGYWTQDPIAFWQPGP